MKWNWYYLSIIIGASILAIFILWYFLGGESLPPNNGNNDENENNPPSPCSSRSSSRYSSPDITVIEDPSQICVTEVSEQGRCLGNFCPSDTNLHHRSGHQSIPEGITCRALEAIYGKPFTTVRPDFLKSPVTGANLEIDCYNHELGIGGEYNGIQHYQWPNFTGCTKDKFIYQVQCDKYKREQCDRLGIYLITVPYTIPNHEIPNYILSQIPKSLLPKHINRETFQFPDTVFSG